jgi:hypothetical protein
VATFLVLLLFPGKDATAMNPTTRQLFASTMARVNARELKVRTDYFAYLSAKGEQDGTLDEFIAKYASLARFGTPASAVTIERLRLLSGPPIPQSLADFYLGTGGFSGGDRLQGLIIHPADELLAMAEAEVPRWKRIRSMGLVDMIVRSWGGERFEFDPATGEGLNQQEVDALNRNYSVIGWHVTDDGEGFNYLYFDAHGRFGMLGFHQDDFESCHEELQAMLPQSNADMTLDEALQAMLKSAKRR